MESADRLLRIQIMQRDQRLLFYDRDTQTTDKRINICISRIVIIMILITITAIMLTKKDKTN